MSGAAKEKVQRPRKTVYWDCGMRHYHKSIEEALSCQTKNYIAIIEGKIKLFRQLNKVKDAK